jgi:E2 binding domain
MVELQECGPLQGKLTKPSIALESVILYMHGPLEAQYRPNLQKRLHELLPGPISNSRSFMLNVTDPSQQLPIRVRLIANDDKMQVE